MDMLQQIFMTAIAAFVFFILIAKIASAVTNGDEDDKQSRTHDFSKVVGEKLKLKTEKSSSKSKSKKKVRFAVDHDEFVVNKVVAGTSETKKVVLEKNHDEELISLNDVRSLVKSPEEGFGGVENQSGRAKGAVELSMVSCVSPLVDPLVVEDDHENEKADYDGNKAREESVSDGVIDYDQIKEGKSEHVDPILSQGTMIREENVANGGENQMCIKLLCDDSIDEEEKEKEGLISEEEDSDDDDWEGVERSDLEKVFAMAADYGKVDDHLQSLGSDIQMQLYGLGKVAMEGPCHEAQPMALKVSARAKWNAWQKLGNMNPDVAMEQYIILLSENVPGWSRGIHSVGVNLSSSSTTSTLNTSQKERKSEIESCSNVGDLIGVSDSGNEDKQ